MTSVIKSLCCVFEIVKAMDKSWRPMVEGNTPQHSYMLQPDVQFLLKIHIDDT